MSAERTREHLAAWHAVVHSRDAQALEALLAEDVVFHSPVVHTPQAGRAITHAYLMAAMHVLNSEHFSYAREIVGDGDVMLEFNTELDGVRINGVDIIRFDSDGRITEFKVMVRPLKAIQAVHQRMGEMLQKMAK